MNPRIILIGGVPGTGKTTLAKAISTNLNITLLNKDNLEATLVEKGISSIDNLNGIGYALMERITLSELTLGRSVILDCVASRQRVDEHWEPLKNKDIKYIECICSNSTLHRTRLESRERNMRGWYELTWDDVKKIAKSYEPCFTKRLVIDSTKQLKKNLEKALEYVSS